MYDIKWIREHPDAFDRGLKRRGLEPVSKKLLALDEKRRAAIAAWSAMVGAMVLARIVDDEKLSKEILSETRASLPLA